jgi:hypothetical protein
VRGATAGTGTRRALAEGRPVITGMTLVMTKNCPVITGVTLVMTKNCPVITGMTLVMMGQSPILEEQSLRREKRNDLSWRIPSAAAVAGDSGTDPWTL